MNQGCVHIYTGDGKGKTTAATGLAVRALGQGWRVGFFQFLKSGHSGELAVLTRAGCVCVSPKAGEKFVWQMNDAEKAACRIQQHKLLKKAASMQQQFDLLVLDEAVSAAGCGMLDENALLAFIEEKSAQLELVLTGRQAGAALLQKAHYVTEMRCLKHPYQQGIAARPGIEF